MKLFKNKQSNDISVIQGGYSDVRLWPCYIIYSSLVLFFSPVIGMALAVFIFTAIGFGVALYARKQMPIITYDVTAWRTDLDVALDKGTELPELENYMIVTPAKVKAPKPKKIATKKRALWPYLDMFGARS